MSTITSVPAVLYKYIKVEHALSILQDLKLKITPPNEFDDPFEFLLRVEGDMSRTKVKKLMKTKEHERKVYELAKAQGIAVSSFKNFKRNFRADREKHVSDAIHYAQPVIAAYLKQPYQADISKRFGVLCLTEVPDSLLMWSHYASGHRGVVIGLEIPPHWKLYKVDYRTERVPVSLELEPGDRFLEDVLVKLVKSKCRDWAYEREWRAISELKKVEKQSRDGKTCYLASIGTEVVKEIILGLRFPEQHLGGSS